MGYDGRSLKYDKEIINVTIFLPIFRNLGENIYTGILTTGSLHYINGGLKNSHKNKCPIHFALKMHIRNTFPSLVTTVLSGCYGNCILHLSEQTESENNGDGITIVSSVYAGSITIWIIYRSISFFAQEISYSCQQ
jgi:hypothetical protein